MGEIKTGLYRHYKGKDYQVLGVAGHTETEERMVVYRALYGEYGLWVRPFSMFTEQIEIEGVLRQRFQFVGD